MTGIPTGKYLNLSAAELSALRTQLESARTAILTAGQAYTKPAISMTRVSFKELTEELHEVLYAQSRQGNTLVTETVADLSA